MAGLSFSFRLLRKLGLNFSETEYGNVSMWRVICRACRIMRDAFLVRFVMNSIILSPICTRKINPWVLRKVGCKVGKGVAVGTQVFFDGGHADMIEIEDNVQLTARCLLLCHQRDLSGYRIGDDCTKLPYKIGKIHICKGAMVGMNTMIMPGVTIGEGASIGAYSLVNTDIPAWTIAVGRPAKVVKYIPQREEQTNQDS